MPFPVAGESIFMVWFAPIRLVRLIGLLIRAPQPPDSWEFGSLGSLPQPLLHVTHKYLRAYLMLFSRLRLERNSPNSPMQIKLTRTSIYAGELKFSKLPTKLPNSPPW